MPCEHLRRLAAWRSRCESTPAALPSALRKDGVLWEIEKRELKTNGDQILAERRTLFDFFQHVDAQGLQIPEDSQQLRRLFDSIQHAKHSALTDLESGKRVWPDNELLSPIALAQHYGIPTRLLDWSRNPLKAALFACKEAAIRCQLLKSDGEDVSGKHLSVWAITPEGTRQRLKLEKVAGRGLDLITVTAPRASNPNLHAQEGLFTLYRPVKVTLKDTVDRRPLDELLQNAVGADATLNRPLMYRFVLPVTAARKLLYLLAKDGIDRATIFQGYDGVAKALRDRALWDRG